MKTTNSKKAVMKTTNSKKAVMKTNKTKREATRITIIKILIKRMLEVLLATPITIIITEIKVVAMIEETIKANPTEETISTKMTAITKTMVITETTMVITTTTMVITTTTTTITTTATLP